MPPGREKLPTMMTVELKLSLRASLATEAQSTGLLTTEAIESMLRETRRPAICDHRVIEALGAAAERRGHPGRDRGGPRKIGPRCALPSSPLPPRCRVVPNRSQLRIGRHIQPSKLLTVLANRRSPYMIRYALAQGDSRERSGR